MRVYSITPIDVGPAELRRRQRRYDELSPPGMKVELHDIGPRAPRALESYEDVRASDRAVTAALRAAGPGYDALLPDCVLDPGVAEPAGDLPVFGILRLCLARTARTGRLAGAVARNRAIADEIVARAGVYGVPLAGVAVLDLDVGAIADSRWAAALGAAVDDLAGRGAGEVVNGCSAVDLPDAAAAGRIPVVDPTALALRLLAEELGDG